MFSISSSILNTQHNIHTHRGIIPGAKVFKLVGGPLAYVVGYIENLIYGPCLSNLASKGIKFNIFGKGEYKKDKEQGLEQVVISQDTHVTHGGGIINPSPGAAAGNRKLHNESDDLGLAQGDGIKLKLNQNINKDGEGPAPSYA